MKTRGGITAVLAGALLVLGQESWAARNRGSTRAASSGTCQTVAPATALAEQEVADLLHLRQEEKLARDTYQALYAVWGVRTFSNIAASEQRHVDAILTLLAAYGIADPLPDDAAGTFLDPEIQGLYEALVTAGSQSLVDALRVGATIEDLDIADLDVALASTDKPDLQRVYANLTQGSASHLRAFVVQLARSDETYTPQFISQERFDAITGLAVSNARTLMRRR